MISLDLIEREIRELEARGETTYSQCERLAWLYTCRDHLLPAKADAVAERMSGSEFLEACDGKPYQALMRVLDEHMEAMRLVFPKEYEKVMDAVRALG